MEGSELGRNRRSENVGTESVCNAEDWIRFLGREDPWKREWLQPLQHSCLENPMDRGARVGQHWVTNTFFFRPEIVGNIFCAGFISVEMFSHLSSEELFRIGVVERVGENEKFELDRLFQVVVQNCSISWVHFTNLSSPKSSSWKVRANFY